MTREADRNLRLLAQDRLIHRCTCGSWVYASRACWCAAVYREEAAA